MRRTLLSLTALAAVLALALPAAAQTTFSFQLFGQAHIPAVATEAFGTCSAVLAADESTLTLSCDHTVANPIATHIHRGFADENGPVLIDLGTPQSPIQATVDLTAEQAVRLLAGGLYVNVHSTEHPNGEIRGQLLPAQPLSGQRMAFPLRGAQEVPPVDTEASGACILAVDLAETPFAIPSTGTVEVRCVHDVEVPTGSHIHLAGRGQNGDVLFDLGSPASPIEATVELTNQQQVSNLLGGGLYVNVHSNAHPDGEIRGQTDVCLASPTTLCLVDGRFSVRINWRTGDDNGRGVAVRETLDSGMFWFFRPSNLEMLVKVLDGCGVNDRFWVFFAPTTNVGFDLQVTDERTGLTSTYRNDPGEQAQPVLDTDAFPTCL